MPTDTATTDTLVREHADLPTTPRERECLPCYLHRMIAAAGCDNHLRWAEIWRQRNKVTGLLNWLRAHGGYCDCEVLFNVYPQCLPEEEQAILRCLGVKRAGSRQPCDLW